MSIEIREYHEDDREALLRTLADVCPRIGDGGTPGAEQWSWAAESNPDGRRTFLALEGGAPVAHLAALPHRVWIDARESRFCELVGDFVHPDRPRGLQREGLYARTAKAFFRAYGGSDADMLFYGWPASRAAWRLQKELCKIEVVRTQCVLTRAPGAGAAETPPEVRELERFDHQARWLWDRCSGDWGASAIRDESFLNWRFRERPGNRYTILGVADAEDVLRGYAVLRRCDWPSPESLLVVDWLVPPAEPEVGELLVRAVLARARAEAGGVQTVTTLLPEWSPWFDAFQRYGFLVVDAGTFLIGRTFVRKFDMLWLRDNWWFTLADTIRV